MKVGKENQGKARCEVRRQHHDFPGGAAVKTLPSVAGRCREAQLASIRQMSGQVLRGSAGEYQAD